MIKYILAGVGILVMNVLDVMYTEHLITYSGSRELNPWANFIINNYGFDGLMLYKMIFCGIILVLIPVAYLKCDPRKKFFIWFALWFTFSAYLVLTVYHILNWTGILL